MGSEIETLEEKLNSFLVQLQAECRVFERMVYKNKNQHRRCSYFQYLLKVRRDLRLLQSCKLEEIAGSCFHVITGRKPRQKVYLLESLKWRKCDSGTPNFMERLLGAARLLSQIVEPMLKAATDISTLLARSFFMGFSLTILALLARLRVLVQQEVYATTHEDHCGLLQQILLDVVSVFNMVSSLSQEKQSVKITQEGLEVFREYYPTNIEFVTLECLWKTDKYVLVEKTHRTDVKGQDGGPGGGSTEKSVPRYWTIESFLADSDSDFEKADEDHAAKEGSYEEKQRLFPGLSVESEHGNQAEGGVELGDNPIILESPGKQIPPKDGLAAKSSSPPGLKVLTPQYGARQVAFVSVKRPAPSTTAFVSVKKSTTPTTHIEDPSSKDIEDTSTKDDSFSNLLAGGNPKQILF
ncbi:hypothetical protein DKX38_017884 [Salix brachista]|uniref:Nucleolus and neural progenitor protein-like N-terminal domain-containing protein n=1 Tax=Salix brachista TaxID=2182728 RepID=A0A5N5KXC2_9ROSI|nr:hypothetical protein DKX38_017884 [Salix brachista]